MDIAGRIIALVSCFMCSVPFFIIAIFEKNSREPITFWSGDKTLKSKIKNIPEYNKKMSALYKKCALYFIASGAVFLAAPVLGIIMLCFGCTIGFYVVYLCYKKILETSQ